MEKTINIDGLPVRFKSTGATMRRYRAQFGTDYFADLMKMIPMIEAIEGGVDFDDLDVATLSTFNFEVFQNIIWVLAKTADPSIPEPIEWEEQFDVLPVMEIIPELQDLILSSFGTVKKNKNHPALKQSR